ncbi:MAG: hypothetical protein ACR2HH_05480 [Chthoniobacterales bacterium]
MKKNIALTFLATALACAPAFAQDAFKDSKEIRTAPIEQKTAIDLFHFDSSYVFESSLDNPGGYGKQDALQTGFEYSHRFLLGGKLYLRAGFAYERFDFSSTSAPVPNHLQSIAGVIGVDYMVGNDVGAFIQVRPGFYTENTFDEDSFDFPITLGRIFILQPDKLYLFIGANAAFLRGEYPVLPLAGLVYRPNTQWNIYAVLPEPRVTYSLNKKLDLYVGGQLIGGSYRTDRNDGIVPHKLSNAQVDYSEYRGGVGLEYHPCEAVSLNLGGGYSFLRRVNFDRAGQEYDADPAPYVRASFRAEF